MWQLTHMNNRHLLLVGCVSLALCACSRGLSQQAAIRLVQRQYVVYKDYPTDTLPPRSIQAEQAADGWFLAFIQNGSGLPILSANCFFVKHDGSVEERGEYLPEKGDTSLHISAKTCSKE